ncbi:hypothetical protein OHC33_000243 [Knufia fluminis]|uniref:Transmembrane protein n=1 Tax=Knufia fluminis TaxID=191047 RepID=A0AAN8ICD0_9EURO|nr:hypothetical protein OHC33_000243 [Knufia fluminis]
MQALPNAQVTTPQYQAHAVQSKHHYIRARSNLTTNSGYSVYYTALGAETPCYSKPTKTYLPATSATATGVTVITDTVFSRRYTLVQPPKPTLPTGGIVGITVNAVLFAAAPFIILWLVRRRKAKKAAKHQRESTGATFPPVEPTLLPQQMSEIPADTTSPTTPHELASPETGVNTPATMSMKGMPYPSGLTQNTPSSPPAYEVPGSTPSDLASSMAFEMPGSTYIHEHHPAFGGSSTDLSRASPPRTPPRSPAQTASTRSPVLSPSSPFRTDSPGTSNIVITPLGSPRPLNGDSPGTRFREQM